MVTVRAVVDDIFAALQTAWDQAAAQSSTEIKETRIGVDLLLNRSKQPPGNNPQKTFLPARHHSHLPMCEYSRQVFLRLPYPSTC